MDGSLKEPKRLQDSPCNPRPTKRHSPSAPSASRNATSSTSTAPRLNMGTFDFCTKADEDEAMEDARRYADYDPYENDYNTFSSPTAARGGMSHQMEGHAPPPYPGAYALNTLEMYTNSPSDDEDPRAIASPPGGVAMALEATTITTDPERSTSPAELGAAENAPPSIYAQTSRGSLNESTNTSGSEDTNLRACNDEQRDDFYWRTFKDIKVPLQDFTPPSMCDEYPELRWEILFAYCAYATFTVKVWANYDSAIKKFYTQTRRLSTCGKLYLHRKQRAFLESKDMFGLQFCHVLMEVGNPFRSLFVMALDADTEGNFEVKGQELQDVHLPHSRLKDLVKKVLRDTKEDGLQPDRLGLTLEDLDQIAKDCVCMPRDEDDEWCNFLN